MVVVRGSVVKPSLAAVVGYTVTALLVAEVSPVSAATRVHDPAVAVNCSALNVATPAMALTVCVPPSAHDEVIPMESVK